MNYGGERRAEERREGRQGVVDEDVKASNYEGETEEEYQVRELVGWLVGRKRGQQGVVNHNSSGGGGGGGDGRGG